MNKHKLLISFMKEQGCISTQKFLAETPKLVRFIRGSYRYQIVYHSDPNDNIVYIFKDRTSPSRRKPGQKNPTGAGLGHTNYHPLEHSHKKLKVDLNDPDSLDRIAAFL